MAELSEIERIVGEAERATSAGDHAAAERALRRVLRLQEAGLGLSHPDVANTLNELAVVCDRLGRPDEAEFLYRRALGIARRTLEPDHPYIVTSLEHLSNLYRAQGKPEKLEKIREGRSPGSGLPELDVVDEAGDGAVAPEEMARPETSATPAPVPSDRAQRPQGNEPHPMFVATSHPAVLYGGRSRRPDIYPMASVRWVRPTLSFPPRMGPGRAGRHQVASWEQASSTRPEVGPSPAAQRRSRLLPAPSRLLNRELSHRHQRPGTEWRRPACRRRTDSRPRFQTRHRSRGTDGPTRRPPPPSQHRRWSLLPRSAASWIPVPLMVPRWPNGGVSLSATVPLLDGSSSIPVSGRGRARPSSIDGCGTGSSSSRSLSTSEPTTGLDIGLTAAKPSRPRGAARGGLSSASANRSSTFRSLSCPDLSAMFVGSGSHGGVVRPSSLFSSFLEDASGTVQGNTGISTESGSSPGPLVPITVLINTLAISLSSLHSAEVRLAASTHNVANLTTEGFRPVRTIQVEVVTGGSTARINQVRSPAEVDLIHETVERSRASLQYTASLRLIAVETDLRGQLGDLFV